MEKSGKKIAILGAGCFWGVQAAFKRIKGVIGTEVGYCGGKTKAPSYQQVCSGRTGHVEVVKITYDPAIITYGQLLDVFWSIHDPTQVDGQGPDLGEQYRSVLFYVNEDQKLIAEKSRSEIAKSGKFEGPVATSIEKAGDFYRAEEYHQDYLEKRDKNNCHIC